MIFKRLMRIGTSLFLICALPLFQVVAAPLPDPLTLQHALELAEEPHPLIAEQQSRLTMGRAEREAVTARSGLNVGLDLYPQYARFAADPERDLRGDSIARLTVRKPITDFGRESALLQAADAEVKHHEILLTEVRSLHRIEVARLFFDVLLADQKFHADDEEMTRLFTPYDRARERAELGMVSQVEVLRRETAFREALIPRTHSDHHRRVTRARLALALNRPGEIPVNLVRPKFSDLNKELPEFDKVVEEALARNPKIEALRQKVAAAEHTVSAQHALRRPVLTGGLELTEWEREVGSRRDTLIGLQLYVPIYQGGTEQAAVAKAEAELASRRAELQLAEIQLRTSILDLLHNLEILKTARRTGQTRLQYREIAADEQRAKYEMEIQTSVGASVAQMTEAEYLAMKAEFDTALTWMRLDALRGQTGSSLEKR